MEYPAYIRNHDSKNLYSVLHLPPDIRGCGFVFCAPLFGEKTKSHRVMVNFARELATRGHPVLRFDYGGDGDSEGRFEEVSLESRVGDIVSAVRHLRTVVNGHQVVLLGLRLGATLAALAAGKLDGVKGLMLWAPVMRVREYLFDCLRANLADQLVECRKVLYNRERLVEQIMAGGTVNVDGWGMTRCLWEQGQRINLEHELHALPGQVLVATMSGMDAAQGQRIGNVCFEQVPEECSWKDWNHYNPRPARLFAASLAWVDRYIDDKGKDRHIQ